MIDRPFPHTPVTRRPPWYTVRFPLSILAAVLLSCAVSRGRAAHAQDVELEIREYGKQKPRIAIAHFGENERQPGRLGVQLRDVLMQDLDYSGIFDAQSRQPPHSDAGMQAARDAGLHLVVRGEYWLQDNEFVWEVRAYDSQYEQQLLGKRYTAQPDWWRMVTHAFADELVHAYTGKPGIAQTQIAYLAQTGNAKELFVMDYDGHDVRQITRHGNLVVAPAWSADGQQIFYTSYHRGNPDLYRGTLATGAVERLSSYNGLNTAAAVSPDGTELALTLSRDGNAEIYLMNLATKKLRRLTYGTAVDTQPTWSPNGHELAFVSDREGAPRIYIMDRDGADLRRITYGVGYTTSPVWSPQGDRIAFVASVDGVMQIMTVTPQGTRRTQVTRGAADCEDPSWSPDGRHIAYSRTERRQNSEIWVIHADGTGARRVSPRGVVCSGPAWSPQR